MMLPLAHSYMGKIAAFCMRNFAALCREKSCCFVHAMLSVAISSAIWEIGLASIARVLLGRSPCGVHDRSQPVRQVTIFKPFDERKQTRTSS